MLHLACLLALLPQVPADGAAPDRLDLIRIDGRALTARWGQAAGEQLSRLELDVANHHAPSSRRLDVVADADDRARLDAAGIAYELVVTDLVAHYRSRLAPLTESPGPYGRWLVPPYTGGSMGGYYTFAQVVSVLDQMVAAYPNLISVRQSIGQGVEGRDLWMVKISDNPGIDEPEPELRIDALHHAREPRRHADYVLWFMLLSLRRGLRNRPARHLDLVDNREMWFVPVVNPDGYVYNQIDEPRTAVGCGARTAATTAAGSSAST